MLEAWKSKTRLQVAGFEITLKGLILKSDIRISNFAKEVSHEFECPREDGSHESPEEGIFAL